MFYDCFNKNGAKDLIEILLSFPLVWQWNGQTTTTLLSLGRFCCWHRTDSNRGLVCQILVSYPSTCKGMKAFEVAYRELPYPHKQSPGYIQKHQVFFTTLLNAVGRVYSHGTLLYTPNLPFLRGQIFRTLHLVTQSKFLEKLQS